MKNKLKWRVDSRYDKTCNAWRKGMRFETKSEAIDYAKDMRKSLWYYSWKVVKNV